MSGYVVRYAHPNPSLHSGFGIHQSVSKIADRDMIICRGNQNKDRGNEMKQIKIIVEKHPEGYVAYPLGLKGVVVGEGDTYEEAVADVKSAIKFHIETFGKTAFETGEIIETFVAEVIV